MSRDDGNDALRSKWYELGKVVEQESFSGRLMGIAATYFARGNDEVARIFRDLARSLEKEAEEARKAHEKQYVKAHP